jgi:hypothetical protein
MISASVCMVGFLSIVIGQRYQPESEQDQSEAAEASQRQDASAKHGKEQNPDHAKQAQ